jgi:hypothetical protein
MVPRVMHGAAAWYTCHSMHKPSARTQARSHSHTNGQMSTEVATHTQCQGARADERQATACGEEQDKASPDCPKGGPTDAARKHNAWGCWKNYLSPNPAAMRSCMIHPNQCATLHRSLQHRDCASCCVHAAGRHQGSRLHLSQSLPAKPTHCEALLLLWLLRVRWLLCCAGPVVKPPAQCIAGYLLP